MPATFDVPDGGDQGVDLFAVRATKWGVKEAARLIREMSGDVKLKQAQQVLAVTDGAESIAKLVQANLPARTPVILDYFHASMCIRPAGRCLGKKTLGGTSGPMNCWEPCRIKRGSTHGS
jgi:hypothetical protein